MTTAAAARQLAPGPPGTWCTLQDVENLKQSGFPAEFRTITRAAQVAKLGVVQQLFPDLDRLFGGLQRLHSENFRRPLGAWHADSFVAILKQNVTELFLLGIPTEDRQSLRISSGFQSAIRDKLKRIDHPSDITSRIR